MKDIYLDKFIKLLEVTAARAHKDLERERKRLDFLEGKVERLDLAIKAATNDAGREYVERHDRAVELQGPRKKPPIAQVPVNDHPTMAEIRAKWNTLNEKEQQEAIDKQNLVVEAKKEGAA